MKWDLKCLFFFFLQSPKISARRIVLPNADFGLTVTVTGHRRQQEVTLLATKDQAA